MVADFEPPEEEPRAELSARAPRVLDCMLQANPREIHFEVA